MKKLIMIAILIILLCDTAIASSAAAAAGGAAAVAVAAHRRRVAEAEEMREKCQKPWNFVTEHKCMLSYESDTSWDTFYCKNAEGIFTLQANCDGIVTGFSFKSNEKIKRENEIMMCTILIVFTLVVLILLGRWVVSKRKRRKKRGLEDDCSKIG